MIRRQADRQTWVPGPPQKLPQKSWVQSWSSYCCCFVTRVWKSLLLATLLMSLMMWVCRLLWWWTPWHILHRLIMLKKKIKFHTNHIHAHIERAWSRSYCGFVSLLYMFLQTVTIIWEKHLATSYNLSKPVSWHGTLRSVNQVFAHSKLQQELETQFTSWRIGATVRALNSCIMLDMIRVKDPSFELGREHGSLQHGS